MFGGAYILSLIALWLKSVSASTLPILPFAPFLTVVLLKRSLASSFILAAIAGFHVDLLSSDRDKVRFRSVIFSNFSVEISAGSIEITQRYGL